MIKKTKHMKTILVIEDEKPLLEVVKTKLEKSGFAVIPVRSVERAFSPPLEKSTSGVLDKAYIEKALAILVELESVDAIWLDHNLLGEEDGLDFVTKFKANGGRLSTVPIFVVSNTSDPNLVNAYAGLGVTKYYIKAEHKLESIVSDIRASLTEARA